MTMTANKRPTQARRILTYLRARGKWGVLNYEFIEQRILRYGARITELRQDGYDIRAKYEGNGVYRYTLIPEGTSNDAD